MPELNDNELLSALFHDMRDPLAAVQMQSRSLLKAELLGPDAERVKRRSEAIARSSERALGLLGDVQDLFRLRRGVLTLNPALHPLSLACEEVLRSASAAAASRQVQLIAEAVPPSATALFDRALLPRALHHVVLLAAAFCAPGATVRLTLHRNAEGVVGHAGDEATRPSSTPLSRSEILGWTLAGAFIQAHPGGTVVRDAAGQTSFSWTSA
jgi:signal transduction histidine kinase